MKNFKLVLVVLMCIISVNVFTQIQPKPENGSSIKYYLDKDNSWGVKNDFTAKFELTVKINEKGVLRVYIKNLLYNNEDFVTFMNCVNSISSIRTIEVKSNTSNGMKIVLFFEVIGLEYYSNPVRHKNSIDLEYLMKNIQLNCK